MRETLVGLLRIGVQADQTLRKLKVAGFERPRPIVVSAVLVAVPSLPVWLLPRHWQAAAVWVGAYVVASDERLRELLEKFREELPR